LSHLEIGDRNPQLPDSITNINIEDLTVTGGVLLENYSGLEQLILAYNDITDDKLKLPALITSFDLETHRRTVLD